MILFCAAYAKYTWCHWLYKTILRLNHFLFLVELLLFLTSAFSKIHFLFSLIKHIKIYFLIRFAQTKITLFSSTTGLISENKSFLLVEPRSRVTCCVEIKLQSFFRKYIYLYSLYCTDTIYCLFLQRVELISAAALGKNRRPPVPKWSNSLTLLPIGKPRAADNMASLFLCWHFESSALACQAVNREWYNKIIQCNNI